MNTWHNPLFFAVFLAQIFVSSYWLPRIILARIDRVRSEYPPERYPRLYPGSSDAFASSRSLFVWACRLVFVLGFAMLYGAFALDGGRFADDGYISEVWPAAYGLCQFMPLVIMELLGFRQLHLMRKANTDVTRKASLRPRRLFDFVSPVLLTLALALLVAVIGFNLYAHDFHLIWGSDAMQQSLVMLVTNLALLMVGVWQLHGRKLNPHQATVDRTRQIRTQLTSLLLISCVLSVFLIWQTIGDLHALHYLDATAMSMYVQLIAILSVGLSLRSLRLDDLDFSAYAVNHDAD